MSTNEQQPKHSSRPEGPPSGQRVILNAEQARALVSKVTWRLIPLLFFCYIIAYIDRINVGFAKLHLREALGVEEQVFNSIYGLGAGLFFIGYFIFELPSNLILQRVGARIWIARIMIFWGIVSACMVFVNSVPMFYFMRFILGASEAGFFPGVILYLTYWFPSNERARTIALFATGGVMAGIIGSPLSGKILELHGFLGVAGWKWLFVLEALPAIAMGFVVLLVLPNRPQQAKWLTSNEKIWIENRLTDEASKTSTQPKHNLSAVFSSGRVWILCLLYFLMNVGGYGYEMWMPSIIQKFSGKGTFVVGLINAIPYIAAGISMVLVSRYADKTGEHRKVVALSAITSTIGFAASAYLQNPILALLGLTVAFLGLKSTIAPIWAMTTAFLTGTGAAGGIALINSVGNLGGFVGPYTVGVIKDRTKSDAAALLFLGAALLGMAVLAWSIRIAKPTISKETTHS